MDPQNLENTDDMDEHLDHSLAQDEGFQKAKDKVTIFAL